MAHSTLGRIQIANRIHSLTGASVRDVRDFLNGRTVEEEPGDPDTLADELGALPMIHRAVYIGGKLFVMFDAETDTMDAPQVPVRLGVHLRDGLRRFSDIDFDRYLYHCSSRPTWLGAVASIADEAGLDRDDVTLVGASSTSFTVETAAALDDSTLRSFELDRVHDVPEDGTEMHV